MLLQRVCGALALLFAATSTTASPTDLYSVHEERSPIIHRGWEAVAPASPSLVLPLRIGLKQQNLNKLEDWLYEVSDPTSPKYGQHWTAQQVADAFRASNASRTAVISWLQHAGIARQRIKTRANGNWIFVNATVQEIEGLLKTQYYVWKQTTSNAQQIGCDSYSLPNSVKQHVDFVLPTTQIGSRRYGAPDPDVGSAANPTSSSSSRIHKRPGPFIGPPIDIAAPGLGTLANCSINVTPDCIRYLYNYTNPTNANYRSTYGIVEYSGQVYSPSDLDLFFSNFSKALVGTRPQFNSVDGGSLSYVYDTGESNLDLQLSMPLSYPLPIQFFVVGDPYQGGSFDTFLDAIDGSYCTYEGGDAGNGDPIYPDPVSYGYQGDDCGIYTPPLVISTSYSGDETEFSVPYANRQCSEYAKLGLMGTTVLFSSGDYGVAGYGGDCYTASNGYHYNNGNFVPQFPAVCPYVTGVGATQITPGTNIVTSIRHKQQPEQAANVSFGPYYAPYFSSGGFSNIFTVPKYQTKAVQAWFSEYAPAQPPGKYNNTGQSRGFPDVSAIGSNITVAYNGELVPFFGTSASSPLFGSLITAINNDRLNLGKSSVGFINPVIYANPKVFHDVTVGSNPGCGTTGFTTSPGWDPVTGLGTPNYPRMRSAFLALP